MSRLDSAIKNEIQDAFVFELGLSCTIRVSVKKGSVKLRGKVEFYCEKLVAEKIAKSIHGVKEVRDEIYVNLEGPLKVSDQEIREAAVRALECNTSFPTHKVEVGVEHAVVNLRGSLEWQYQRESAYNAVKYLFGIKDITNNITLLPLDR